MAFQTFENNENNRGQIKRKNLTNEIRSTWLGVRDSNPRMPGPKPGALPLGQPPLLAIILNDILRHNSLKFNLRSAFGDAPEVVQ